MPKTRNQTYIVILFLGDIAMVLCAFVFSCVTRWGWPQFWSDYRLPFTVSLFLYLINFYIFDIYDLNQRFKGTRFLSRFLTAVFFGLVLSAICSYSIPQFKVGRGLALFSAFYITLLLPFWRFIFEDVFVSNVVRKRVLIVGAGRVGRFIYEVIKNDRNYDLIGFVDDDDTRHDHEVGNVRVLGGADKLLEMAEGGQIDMVVVAITNQKRPVLLAHLLLVKMAHVDIVDVPSIYEEVSGRMPMEHLRVGWIVFASFKAMSRHLYINLKRYFDIFLSLFFLIVASPLIVLTAIFVRLDSKGPVIYKQKRVGQDGKEFTMYKFRSMIVDAEKKEGGLYTSTQDPRVTRVGQIIRKIRFDEFPQLWNILIGNMSFVGPRPEAVELSEKYEKVIPYYTLRHMIKPGLTGWAQVRYRYSASTEAALEKFEFDMYYLKNMSFFLDVQIILKTINVIVFREFSR